MSPIHFKLVKSDGHTRRVTFSNLPSWHELASKLHDLYDIPLDKVGVSYVDNDNDEITASSDEELQDFYQTSHQPGKPFKFKVLDLSLPPDNAQSEPFPPISPSNRNTFGQNTDTMNLSDWQRFTVAEYLDSTSDGPHAFVEIVNSDVSGFVKDQDDATNADSEDGQSTIQPAFIDKGKQKASSLGASSTASVLEAEASRKYPVHVLNHAHSRSPDVVNSQGETAVHNTPKVQTGVLNVPTDENSPHDDPPLPTIETPRSNASATLTNDIATLLSTLTNVISSHPELSEGVRNIVHNAASGTYWQAHRAALSQVANDMQQATGNFEQEAAQRVSESLGNIFRSFSQVTGDANGTGNAPQQPTPAPEGQRPFSWYQSPLPGSRHPWGRRYTTGFDSHRFPPWYISPRFERGHPVYGPPLSPGPPPPPPPGPFPGPGYSVNNGSFPPFFSYPPPPPPPPPHFHHVNVPPLPREAVPRCPSPPPGLFSEDAVPNDEPVNGPAPGDPPSPPQRPVNEHPDARDPPPPFSGGHFHGHRGRHLFGANLHRHHGPSSAGEAEDVPNIITSTLHYPSRGPLYSNPFMPHPHNPDQSSSKPTPQQLRAQVEDSKRVYKEHKEMYRREREQRKNDKGGHIHDDGADIFSTNLLAGETSQGPSHIVSKAWGSYPQLEMYSSGPRRHNTHPGHGTTSRDDLTARAQSRIARRLSDMGFSENSHPNLPDKIKAQMQSKKVITKEEEDDIVTNLLEELLALASKSPVAASGSSAKDKAHNESWGL